MADLVLLHGFTQTGRSWQPIGHALAGRYRAAMPDLPGHGAFAQRRPATFPACDAYLRALADGPSVLCGYSMGGRIALHAAFSLGTRVRRLVLIGAGPGIADPAERAARRTADTALADRIEAIGVDAFATEWEAQPLFAGMPRGVAELAGEDRRRNTPTGLAAALRGLGTGAMPSLWERLPELDTPRRPRRRRARREVPRHRRADGARSAARAGRRGRGRRPRGAPRGARRDRRAARTARLRSARAARGGMWGVLTSVCDTGTPQVVRGSGTLCFDAAVQAAGSPRRPGRRGTAIMPRTGASATGIDAANAPTVARPHHGSGASAAAAWTPAATPSGPSNEDAT